MNSPVDSSKVAVIGVATRLPGGVTSHDQFWRALIENRSLITEMPSDRWNRAKFVDSGRIPTAQAGWLEETPYNFDPGFFGISTSEASQMDPQFRLLLQATYECIEDSLLRPEALRGTQTGVFVGGNGTEFFNHQTRDPELVTPYTSIGGMAAMLANRSSYHLDLHGPSLAIDTACSSALYAIHAAYESIVSGRLSLALAGGINLLQTPELFIGFTPMGVLARDGRCKSFDRAADGFVRAEGVGVVMLKALDQAIEDGDKIYAVIAGGATNHDGSHGTVTTPNSDAQVRLLERVYDPESAAELTYLETHGTGTPEGDPMEARAIGKALGQNRSSPLLIGSVKTNVGHLEWAAGMVGFIKAVLIAHHRTIPASLNFVDPNPNIDFEDLNIRVCDTNTPIEAKDIKIGVNSFGMGGANAHILVESYTPPVSSPAYEPPRPTVENLFCLSAKSDASLRQMASRYADRLLESPFSVNEVAQAVLTCRDSHDRRAYVTGATKAEVARKLTALATDPDAAIASAVVESPKVGFVFSGQGKSVSVFGRALYENNESFRKTIDRCEEIVRGYDPDLSLVGSLWSGPVDLEAIRACAPLDQIRISFFQMGYVAMLREDYGVTPDCVLGHSIGEGAAAYASGILSLEDAVKVVYFRSTLQQETLDTGGMLAVGAPLHVVQEHVSESKDVCVAAINSGTSVTLSGDFEELERLKAVFKSQNIKCKLLASRFPYHSATKMSPIKERLLDALSDLEQREPKRPFIGVAEPGAALQRTLNNDYWWMNVSNPVHFQEGIDRLLARGVNIILEIGQYPVLAPFIYETAKDQGKRVKVVPAVSPGHATEFDGYMSGVGELYAAGAELVLWREKDIRGYHPDLPLYPWNQKFCLSESMDTKMFKHSGPAAPLLYEKMHSSPHVWKVDFRRHARSYLVDHKVDEMVVFPAAGMIEVVLEAIREISDSDVQVSLDDVEFKEMLRIDVEDQLDVRVVLDRHHGFTLSSYRYDPSSQEIEPSWIEHCVGSYRILASHAPLAPLDEAAVRAQTYGRVEGDRAYQQFAQCGLHYGTTFRLLREICIGDGLGLGEVVTTGVDALSSYVFHPAVLDACFQSMLGCLPNYFRGKKTLPIRVERIEVLRPFEPDQRVLVHSQIRATNRTDATVDLVVADERGEVYAKLTGFTVKDVEYNLRKMRNPPTRVYSDDWQAFYTSQGFVDRIPALVEQTTQTPEYLSALAEFRDSRQYEPELQYLIAATVVNAFAELGLPLDETIRDADLRDFGVDPQNRQYVEALYEMASAQSFPRLSEEEITVKMQGLLQMTDDPSLELADRVRHALVPILRDNAAAVSSLFGDDLMSRFYSSNPVSAAPFVVISKIVKDYVADHPGVLSVLEAAAGTGAMSRRLVPLFDPAKTNYFFTDLSPAFFENASEVLRDHEFVKYRTFDLEVDAVQQGFLENSLDVVFVYSALHATSDLSATLHNVRKLLKPGGLIVQVELTGDRYRTIDFMFGVFEGWWSFEDKELRPRTCLLTGEQWDSLLARSGFEKTVIESFGDSDLSLIISQKAKASEGERAFQVLPINSSPVMDGIVDRLPKSEQPTHLLLTANQFDEDLLEALQDALLLGDVQTVTVLWEILGDFADFSVFGLVRSLAAEHQDLRFRVVGFDATADREEVLKALRLDSDEVEFLVRGADVEVRRISPMPAATFQADEETRFGLEIRDRGQIENIEHVRLADTAPRCGEVTVKVSHTGVNFKDLMLILGNLEGLGERASMLGFDIVGEVLEVGEGVPPEAVGERVVVPFHYTAGYTSHITIPYAKLPKVPQNLSLAEAATTAVVFSTIYKAFVETARIRKGDKILIHSAAGGIGLAAIQMARLFECEIFVTVGTPEKVELMKSLGIRHIMHSRDLSWADDIMRITEGEGVDIVLNSLAGEAIPRGMAVVKPQGKFLEIGAKDVFENSQMAMSAFKKGISYHFIDFASYSADDVADLYMRFRDWFEEGKLTPLPHRLFPVSEIQDAMQYMTKGEHIGKLVIDYTRGLPEVRHRQFFRSDGAYLVTGGLGGFGLALAEWLIERGAGAVYLTRYRAPVSPETEHRLGRMRAQGAHVEVIQLDVSDREQVGACLESVRSKHALRGVFHLAMRLDDQPFISMLEEDFMKVYETKSHGARYLDELTAEDPLEHFMMWSSITCIFGNVNQSNYVAGNAYLDSLAHDRRRRGRPAVSVAWGAIKDFGYVAKQLNNNVAQFLADAGQLGMDQEETFDALDAAFLGGQTKPVLAAMKIDWARHHIGNLKLYDGHLRRDETVEDGHKDAGQRIVHRLEREFGITLSAEAMDVPLVSFGLDSLGALQLSTWVERAFGVRIGNDRLGDETVETLISRVEAAA